MANIYGMQKIPETSPRSGGDIAMQSTMLGAQGAMAGAQFGGPIGAAVGGGLGLAAGAIGGFRGKRGEERQQNEARAHNKFINGLEGRVMREENIYAPQARNGMENGRYTQIEVEGDGKPNGTGEVVMDKSFNVKSIHNGAPKHEEGGEVITAAEGDIVFPTQGDKKKQEKLLSAVKRYKLRGDKKAKKYLESERDSLPSDDAPEKANGDSYIETTEQGPRSYSASQVAYAPTSHGDPWAGEGLRGSIYEMGGDPPKSPQPEVSDGGSDTSIPQDEPAGSGPPPERYRGNPLKYASAINNVVQGIKAIDPVERRQYTPTQETYRDYSQQARRDLTEQRNFQSGQLRGKGLSAGQQQSYNQQIGNQYARRVGDINSQEVQRRDSVQNRNLQRYDQGQMTNLGLQNQYDDQDAQARAVKQRYFDQGVTDTSQLAQLDEQAGWMKRRNDKQYEMDKMRLGYYEDWVPDYQINDPGEGVEYRTPKRYKNKGK